MLFLEKYQLMGQVISTPSKDLIKSPSKDCSRISSSIWFTIKCFQCWDILRISRTTFTTTSLRIALTILTEEQETTAISSLFRITCWILSTKISRTSPGHQAYSLLWFHLLHLTFNLRDSKRTNALATFRLGLITMEEPVKNSTLSKPVNLLKEITNRWTC